MGDLGHVSNADVEWSHEVEGQVFASAATRRELVVTWDAVRMAGVSDAVYAELLFVVGSNRGDEHWEASLAEYKRFK